MKKLALAIALALATTAAASAAEPAAPAAAAAPAQPAWIARSNDIAKTLLDVQAEFQPEVLSFFGIAGYDEQISDFSADANQRQRKALTDAKAKLDELGCVYSDNVPILFNEPVPSARLDRVLGYKVRTE